MQRSNVSRKVSLGALGLLSVVASLAVAACGASSAKSNTSVNVGTGGQLAAAGAGAGGQSAGGGNSGGQGGADTPAPHMLRACPTNKVGTVGVWEPSNPTDVAIPPPSGKYGASMIVVNPQDTTIVFAAYDGNGIYKSTDCGATWKKAITGRNADVLSTGSSWTMVIDPVDPQTMYANNGYGSGEGVFKSTNGGADWDQTIPSDSVVGKAASYNFATRISMDPTNHRHLVVAFHSGCTGDYAPNCLAETVDAGASWKPLKISPSGAEASGIALVDSKTWLYGGTGAGLYLTTDAGQTWSKVNDDGGYIYYRSKQGVYYIGASSGVLSSMDLKTWTKNGSAPAITGLASDGELIYGGLRYCQAPAPCYITSPESDGTVWTDLKTAVMGQGGIAMAYDPDHHILYSANETAGVWRVLLH